MPNIKDEEDVILTPDIAWIGFEIAYLNLFQSLGTEAAILNQLANYLSTPISSVIDDLTRATGIQQIQQELQAVQNDIESLSPIFTQPLKGDGSFEGVITSGEDIISRAERILDTYDRLEEYANDILDKIDYTIDAAEYTFDYISELPDKIQQELENFKNTLNMLSDFDLTNVIDKLPDLISDNLMNLSIVQDSLIAVQNIQTSVVSVTTAITNLRGAPNLVSLRSLLKTLSAVLSAAKALKSQYDRIQTAIQRLSSLISSGNYIQLAIALAQGGVTFFEIPIDYGTKYPHNNGYQTSGGIKKEEDNTPGKQRLSITHPAGTTVNINPDGTMVFKGKKDVQLVVGENGDILVNKALTITVKGDTRLVSSGGVTVESSGNCNISSTGQCLVNSATSASIVAGLDVNVTAGGAATVSSIGGSEISAKGPVTVSSDVGINLISEKGFINMAATNINMISTTSETHTSPTILNTAAALYKVISASIQLN